MKTHGQTNNKNNLVQKALYLATIPTALVSAYASLPYLSNELGTVLGATSSLVLGAGMIAGFDITFNHTGFFKRITATTIACGLLAVSSFTIYQDQISASINTQNTQLQQQQSKVASKATLKHELLISTRSNAQADKTRLLAENNADKLSAKTLQDQLNAPRDNITKFKANRKRMESYISDYKTAIASRTALIATKESIITTATNTLLNETVSTAPTAKVSAVDNIDIMLLAKSSLADLATLIFLLLASFYRTEKKRDDDESTAGIYSAIADAQNLLAQQNSANAESQRETATLLASINAAKQSIQAIANTAQTGKQTNEQLMQQINLAVTAINKLDVANDVLKDADEVIEKVQLAGIKVETKTKAITQKAVVIHDKIIGNIEEQKDSAKKAKKELKHATTLAEKTNNSFAGANEPDNKPANDLQMKNKEIEFLKKLENREIQASKKHLITPEIVQKSLNIGRHKAMQYIKNAIEIGKLVSVNVNSGTSAAYPEIQNNLNLNTSRGLHLVG